MSFRNPDRLKKKKNVVKQYPKSTKGAEATVVKAKKVKEKSQ